MNPVKKLNAWLGRSFHQWDYDNEKEGCYVLWFALISFITLFAGQFIFRDITTLFSLLCLGVTFVPPLVLGVRCLVRKEKFNPLYWFLGVKGVVYGGLLACLALFVIRGIMFIVETIF